MQKQNELIRDFGLLKATALNMSNMVGIGPFITMHLIIATMGGPQAMLGWIVGIVLAVSDGMIWCELSSAMPGSGGTYVYLRESFGRQRWGRFMAFLFIWQFILSGPLEIASGAIGFATYAGYLLPGMPWWQQKIIAATVPTVAVLLLYRKITAIGKLTVGLWIAMLATVLFLIASGFAHFRRELVFPFPPGALDFNAKFLLGLGGAMQIAMYDYLGYYDVCYVGDEVRKPERTIPRSILISVVAVAAIYMAMNLTFIGVIPWQQISERVAADFVETLYGPAAASLFTGLILVTAFASVFALFLGYSRIPYAAAKDGAFFSFFTHVHPTGKFPDRSLVVLGLVTIVASLFDLSTVIAAIFTCRIVVQFLGQNIGLMRYRRHHGAKKIPFKMWLYPIPCWIAFLGWTFIFATSGWEFIVGGLAVLALGVGAFFVWSFRTEGWPFERG